MFRLFALSLLLSQKTSGLIPGPCVVNGRPNSSRVCCPTPNIPNAGPCGSNLSPPRGLCSNLSAIIPVLVINSSGDTRDNWPYYFDSLCKCNGNYGGFDCSECAFGYTGSNCVVQQLRTRKSTADFTEAEREQFLNALNRSKFDNYTKYMAIKKKSNPPEVVQLSLYNVFVWLHYYTGKENDLLRDNNCKDQVRDYAHEASGFLTWHRILLLWTERELQILIKNDSFSLPYWDWTKPKNRKSVLTNDWFGASTNGAIQGRFANWKTICWNKTDITCDTRSILCDPTVTTGPIRRCPNDAACLDSYQGWPTQADVNNALIEDLYDSNPYSFTAKGFRGYLEGFLNNSCNMNTNPLCVGGIERKLHNTGHIILGIGGFMNNMYDPGTMASVPAASNDPIFLAHHTMVDYIFEQWLVKHPEAKYVGPDTKAFPNLKGHAFNDVLVPFIPLYTNDQGFKLASSFGYQYNPSTTPLNGNAARISISIMSALLMVVSTMATI